MHMIGISGRCPAERRSSSGLYPFPFDARARRGCTSISASKTGCQWCRALVSETPLSIAWAYLMVVSRRVPTRATGAGPGTEISRGFVSAAVGRGGFRRSKWASYRWEVQKRRLDFYERHPKPEMVPYLIIGTLVLVLALAAGLACADPSAKRLRDLSENVPRRDPTPGPDSVGRQSSRRTAVPVGVRFQRYAAGYSRSHPRGFATVTIRAFPRSTRIWAIVLGNVTTSSFFNRYVVSIPANGGRSSSTCTRTWSLRLGGTGTRFVSSARTTFIRSGSFFALSDFGAEDGGVGVSTSVTTVDPPNACARLFARRATMLSKRPRS